MMLRRVKGFAFAVALTGSALAIACASASAAPVKNARSLALSSQAFLTAFDGQDVYWVTSTTRAFKHSITTVDSVYRSSFNESGTVLVYRTAAKSFESIDSIDAGGGVVAIGIERPALRRGQKLIESVVRVNRDGTGAQVIAAGVMKSDDIDPEAVVENGVVRLDDCGTEIWPNDVSASGEVFYTRIDRERDSAGCGGKPNLNRVQVIGVALSGSAREVYSRSEAPEPHFRIDKSGKPSGYCTCGSLTPVFTVSGDYAVVAPTGDDYSVLNLTTGAALTIPPNSRRRGYSHGVDVTSNGQIIDTQVTAKTFRKRGRRHFKYSYFTTVFPTPGSVQPQLPVALRAQWALTCGDKMFAILQRRSSQVIFQIDPATGAVARVVGSVPAANSSEGVAGCSPGFMYASKYTHSGKELFTLLPLG